MDNLKFLRENISELERLNKNAHTRRIYKTSDKRDYEKMPFIYLNLLTLKNNSKPTSSRNLINLFNNFEEVKGYYKNEITPSTSIIYNDFSVYYFDEHTEAEFLPKQTYLYRKYIHSFLQNIDEVKANEYLQSLKEYIKQHKTQEKETVKYLNHAMNAIIEVYDSLDEDRVELKKVYLNRAQWLDFYEDALSNNKDTI